MRSTQRMLRSPISLSLRVLAIALVGVITGSTFMLFSHGEASLMEMIVMAGALAIIAIECTWAIFRSSRPA